MIELPIFDKVTLNEVNVHQGFLQWLGKVGNCNITIQQRKILNMIKDIRFVCTHCNKDLVFTAGQCQTLSSGQIEPFAREHRHDKTIPVVGEGGRRFRNDD